MSAFDRLRTTPNLGGQTPKRAAVRPESDVGFTPHISAEIAPKPRGLRDERGRLLPGTPALNPGGRPKGAAEMARQLLERSRGWEYLEDIVSGLEDVSPQLRAEITLRMVDRAHGKPVAVSVNAETTPEALNEAGVFNLDAVPQEHLDAFKATARAFAELEEKRLLQQGVTEAPALGPAQEAGNAKSDTEGKTSEDTQG